MHLSRLPSPPRSLFSLFEEEDEENEAPPVRDSARNSLATARDSPATTRDATTDAIRVSSWFPAQTEKYGMLIKSSTLPPEEPLIIVADRIEDRRLRSAYGREIHLVGELDVAGMAMAGAPLAAMGKFRRGFPPDWKEVWPRPPPPPPPPLRRSDRLAVVVVEPREGDVDAEEEDDDDEDTKMIKAVKRLDALNPRRGMFDADDDDENDDGGNKGGIARKPFSQAEKERLHSCILSANPRSVDFWEEVARAMGGTRGAEECRLEYMTRFASAASNKPVGAKRKHESEFEYAKAGTAKFRKQMRNRWNAAMQQQYRGGEGSGRAAAATPSTRGIILGGLTRDPEEQEHGKYNNNNNNNNVKRMRRMAEELLDITTPYAGAGRESHLRGGEEEESPAVLGRLNKDKMDDYVVQMVKANKRIEREVRKKRSCEAAKTSSSSVRAAAFEHHDVTKRVRGAMTPGGSVRLQIEKTQEEEEEEEEDEWGEK